MIKPNELKVGDVFYGVKERNTCFRRKKIHQVINGEDWFRYDIPLLIYEVVTYEVLGILRKQLEGEWNQDEEYELETQFFLQSTNNTHVQNYTDTLDDEETYFVDKSEAIDYIKLMELEAKELDKT
jgi:hypothetical protein